MIDDDVSVCKALCRLLRAAGLDARGYTSAEDFLDASLPNEPDCLVLDIHMPGLSGPALRDQLQAMGRRIPVVFITGHATEEDATDSADALVLRKPFTAHALLDAIHSVTGSEVGQ